MLAPNTVKKHAYRDYPKIKGYPRFSVNHSFTRRFEPQRQKTYLRTCAPSEDSDQPAHSRSLIRTFTRRILDSQGCKVSSWGRRILWSYCAHAQADLSLRWAHMSEKVRFLTLMLISLILKSNCAYHQEKGSLSIREKIESQLNLHIRAVGCWSTTFDLNFAGYCTNTQRISDVTDQTNRMRWLISPLSVLIWRRCHFLVPRQKY